LLDAIRNFGQSGAVLLLGLAVGGAWMAAIVAPNTSYDNLDSGDADRHVKGLLKSASDPLAVLLLVAGGLAILGGALVAGITALLAAFGFFTNRWTLGKTQSENDATGDTQVGKTQRILAVSLTLIFTLVAVASAGLAMLGY